MATKKEMKQELQVVGGKALDEPIFKCRMTRPEWDTLKDTIWPAAKTDESIEMAVNYCRARKLDPFKRVVHIVPIWDKAKGKLVDTVWPGIAELRTTAARTSHYAGKDDAVFGKMITEKLGSINVTYPESCTVTVYRLVKNHRVGFTATVWWLECYATVGKSKDPNSMWLKRTRGQLAKCAEAEALREAFPEELGGEPTSEEMAGQQMIDITPADPEAEPEKEPEVWELIDMDGEVVEFQNADAFLLAFSNLVIDIYPDAEINEVTGNYETNLPALARVRQTPANKAWVDGIKLNYSHVLKGFAARGDGQTAPEGGNTPETDEAAQEASDASEDANQEVPTPASPLRGGNWGRWLPWFAGIMREGDSDTRKALREVWGKEVEFVLDAKTDGAKKAKARMVKLLEECGIADDDDVLAEDPEY